MGVEQKSTLFDFLNSISDTKEDLLLNVEEKEYNGYMVNRFLSFSADTILYSQAMNERYGLAPSLQYDYLRNGIRKKKRFFKYIKKEKEDKLDIVKEYFGYSDRKAREALVLLDEYDIEHMKKLIDTGGHSGGKKAKD